MPTKEQQRGDRRQLVPFGVRHHPGDAAARRVRRDSSVRGKAIRGLPLSERAKRRQGARALGWRHDDQSDCARPRPPGVRLRRSAAQSRGEASAQRSGTDRWLSDAYAAGGPIVGGVPRPCARLTFKIGACFPVDDPVARFLTILGMMSNDLLRLVSWLIDDEQGEENDRAGERVFSFRLQASAFFEASKFMRESVPRWPEINQFIAGLPDEAREQLQRVAGSTDPSSGEYVGEWIEKHRNVTFHYSEMHPERAAAGKEEISVALAGAADILSEIELGEILISMRFPLADQVAVQWLPEGEHAACTLDLLRERVFDLVGFTQHAIYTYVSRLDPARRPVFEQSPIGRSPRR